MVMRVGKHASKPTGTGSRFFSFPILLMPGSGTAGIVTRAARKRENDDTTYCLLVAFNLGSFRARTLAEQVAQPATRAVRVHNVPLPH